MNLSIKAKDAIKTAIAMTIAYGVALAMEWERPYWAGFAVAFISLGTIERSLEKGILRMLGTLAAGAVALTLIAIFPQQRWWFMVTLSIYVGICTYMMTGSKIPYFYQVSAFVCTIICFDGGVNSVNAFQTAIARIEETAMGIIVYVLVAIFIWPRNDCKDDERISVNKSQHSQIKILSIDPQRLSYSLEVMINTWIAYLIWIYFNPPGHGTFVAITATMSLVLVRFPSIPASSQFLPTVLSSIFAGILYIFIMPHLSGFSQLGMMIFICTFGISYFFYKPAQGLSRVFGLAYFATLTSITNQQSFSFSTYANSFLMIILIVSLLCATDFLLFRHQSDKTLLRLIKLYFPGGRVNDASAA